MENTNQTLNNLKQELISYTTGNSGLTDFGNYYEETIPWFNKNPSSDYLKKDFKKYVDKPLEDSEIFDFDYEDNIANSILRIDLITKMVEGYIKATPDGQGNRSLEKSISSLKQYRIEKINCLKKSNYDISSIGLTKSEESSKEETINVVGKSDTETTISIENPEHIISETKKKLLTYKKVLEEFNSFDKKFDMTINWLHRGHDSDGLKKDLRNYVDKPIEGCETYEFDYEDNLAISVLGIDLILSLIDGFNRAYGDSAIATKVKSSLMTYKAEKIKYLRTNNYDVSNLSLEKYNTDVEQINNDLDFDEDDLDLSEDNEFDFSDEDIDLDFNEDESCDDAKTIELVQKDLIEHFSNIKTYSENLNISTLVKNCITLITSNQFDELEKQLNQLLNEKISSSDFESIQSAAINTLIYDIVEASCTNIEINTTNPKLREFNNTKLKKYSLLFQGLELRVKTLLKEFQKKEKTKETWKKVGKFAVGFLTAPASIADTLITSTESSTFDNKKTTECYCKYCGFKERDIKWLTQNKCRKNPHSEYHEPFRNEIKDKCYCKYCGFSERDIWWLTQSKCKKNPNSEYHEPYEYEIKDKVYCKYCGFEERNIWWLTQGKCRKNPHSEYHEPK